MDIHRRYFLQQAGAIALGFTGLHSLMGCTGTNPGSASSIPNGFGPLVPDPDQVFDLPKGFSYTIISRFGDKMDDGLLVPHRADGMATFPGPNNSTIVVRNHEINSGAPLSQGPFGANNELLDQFDKSAFYDAGKTGRPAMGGTTTFVYDTNSQQVRRQHLSLAGTLRNCAGGPTPWNSWVTCEETVQREDENLAADHGYCFEVPAEAKPSLADPLPIKAMGRFNHEAIAVDPDSGVVYLTEDRGDGLIYRYIPEAPGELHKGGQLQALVVRDEESLDTRNWEEQTVTPGSEHAVTWIDLENVEAPDDDLRLRGFEDGAARFARGEGMWYGDGAVYFACTNGGRIRKGQIWKYTPSSAEGTSGEDGDPGMLELFVEPNDGTLIENADNLTVSPWGDVIVCEDGSGDQYLVGITPEGNIYKFGRNAVTDPDEDSASELAGATFSPDGSTLFLNIQAEGLTLAITGPWHEQPGS